MHEMSIVESLVNLCEQNLNEICKDGKAHEIKEIIVKVGRLSGVEAHYLQSCYDVFRQGTVCENAELKIHIQDVVIECEKCGYNGVLEQNHFICPECKSTNLKVTDGEDLYLMQLVIE